MGGFASLIGGLLRGYGETSLELSERERQQERQSKMDRMGLLYTVLSSENLDPKMVPVVFEEMDRILAEGEGKGKGKGKKGGLKDLFGGLFGMGMPPTGSPAGEKPGVTPPTVPPQTAQAAAVTPPTAAAKTTGPIPGTEEAKAPPRGFEPLPEVPKYDWFLSEEEKAQREVETTKRKVTSQQEALAPYRRKERAMEFAYNAAMRKLDNDALEKRTLALDKARREARRVRTGAVHKEGAPPWVYVDPVYDGNGELVGEERAEPPAHIQQNYQRALALAGEGASEEEVLEQYKGLLGADVERERLLIQSSKLSIAAKKRLEQSRADLEAGKLTPQRARLELRDLRRLTSERRRNADDPVYDMSYPEAFLQVARDEGLTEEEIERVRAISRGELAPGKPTGLSPAGAKYLERIGGAKK